MRFTINSRIANVVSEYGVNNIVVQTEDHPLQIYGMGTFQVAFTSSNDPLVWVTRKVTTRRYDPAEDDYKIELEAVETEEARFGYKSYYTSDFDSIWRDGFARVFVVSQDGDQDYYTEISFN